MNQNHTAPSKSYLAIYRSAKQWVGIYIIWFVLSMICGLPSLIIAYHGGFHGPGMLMGIAMIACFLTFATIKIQQRPDLKHPLFMGCAIAAIGIKVFHSVVCIFIFLFQWEWPGILLWDIYIGMGAVLVLGGFCIILSIQPTGLLASVWITLLAGAMTLFLVLFLFGIFVSISKTFFEHQGLQLNLDKRWDRL